jgi:large subunit ribosomal protein L31
MKDGIHPEYRPVVFLDRGANFGFLTRSTARTDKTIVWDDGVEYPLVTLDVSSASHPFYTGQQTILDVAGRVERFNRRRERVRGGERAASPATDAPPDRAASARESSEPRS